MSKTVINSKVVDTDSFLEMPPTSRLLYYDLLLRSDNDGFITPLKVIRLTGASQDDLKILVAKGFAYAWDDGVIVLLHYREHNHVKHYSPSDYWPRLRQLKGKYALGAREDGATLAPGRSQDGANVAPQVKLSKDKINKVNTYNTTSVVSMTKNEVFISWEETIAPITTTVETQRKSSVSLLNRYGLESCMRMIRVVAHAHSNQYARKEVKVQSLAALLGNWDKLVIYAKTQSVQKPKLVSV